MCQPVSLRRVSVLIRSKIFSCKSSNFVTCSCQCSGHVSISATRIFTIPRSILIRAYVSTITLNTELRLNTHIQSVSFIMSPSKAAPSHVKPESVRIPSDNCQTFENAVVELIEVLNLQAGRSRVRPVGSLEFFIDLVIYGCTMALGSTHPTTFTCQLCIPRKFWEPQNPGTLRTYRGIALPLTYSWEYVLKDTYLLHGAESFLRS